MVPHPSPGRPGPRARLRFFDPTSPVLACRAHEPRTPDDPPPDAPEPPVFALLRAGGLGERDVDRLALFARYEEVAPVAGLLGIDPGHASRLRRGLLERARLALLAAALRAALAGVGPVVLDPRTGRCSDLRPDDLVLAGPSVRVPPEPTALARGIGSLRADLTRPGVFLCAWGEGDAVRLRAGRVPPEPTALAVLLPPGPADAEPGRAPLEIAA